MIQPSEGFDPVDVIHCAAAEQVQSMQQKCCGRPHVAAQPYGLVKPLDGCLARQADHKTTTCVPQVPVTADVHLCC